MTLDDSARLEIAQQAKQSRTSNQKKKLILHCFDSLPIVFFFERKEERWLVRDNKLVESGEKCGPFGFPIVSIAF